MFSSVYTQCMYIHPHVFLCVCLLVCMQYIVQVSGDKLIHNSLKGIHHLACLSVVHLDMNLSLSLTLSLSLSQTHSTYSHYFCSSYPPYSLSLIYTHHCIIIITTLYACNSGYI